MTTVGYGDIGPKTDAGGAIAMDDYAIALDEAIGQALDGAPAAARRSPRLRERVPEGVNERLLAEEDASVGGNLSYPQRPQRAAVARDGAPSRLSDARGHVAEARNLSGQGARGVSPVSLCGFTLIGARATLTACVGYGAEAPERGDDAEGDVFLARPLDRAR